MIKKVWREVVYYKQMNGTNAPLEIRMHPATYRDCLNCSYHEVLSAFDLSPSSPNPTKMFGFPFRLDDRVEIGSFILTQPRT